MSLVSFKPREIEGQFEIITAPPALRATGYRGDLAIRDIKNNIAYPVNATNMCLLMNGHTNVTGVQL